MIKALALIAVGLSLSGCVLTGSTAAVSGALTLGSYAYQAYCHLPEETRTEARDKLTGGRQYLCTYEAQE